MDLICFLYDLYLTDVRKQFEVGMYDWASYDSVQQNSVETLKCLPNDLLLFDDNLIFIWR